MADGGGIAAPLGILPALNAAAATQHKDQVKETTKLIFNTSLPKDAQKFCHLHTVSAGKFTKLF